MLLDGIKSIVSVGVLLSGSNLNTGIEGGSDRLAMLPPAGAEVVAATPFKSPPPRVKVGIAGGGCERAVLLPPNVNIGIAGGGGRENVVTSVIEFALLCAGECCGVRSAATS